MNTEEIIGELQETIRTLTAQIDELMAWKEARTDQQLFYPVDDVSKAALGAWTGDGAGSIGLTTTVNIPSVPNTITIPKIPSGVRVVNIGGSQFNIPFYL